MYGKMVFTDLNTMDKPTITPIQGRVTESIAPPMMQKAGNTSN